MNTTIDAAELKQVLKEALTELLIERREEFQELLAETFEDLAMARAIHEGEDTPLVDKANILRLLESEQ